MTTRTARRIAAVTLLLAVAAPALFGRRMHSKMRDFEVYWTAGARAKVAEPLYRPEDGHYRFKYLPGFAIVMSPMSSLSLATAKAAWLGFSVAALVAFVALAVALIPNAVSRRGLVAALTVVSMAKFFGHELVLGQVNLLFGLTAAIGLAALRRRRDFLGGLCFGVATLIKPYAVAFVIYLLLIRRWRAAAAAAFGIVLALAVPVPRYGVRSTAALTTEWWRTATETSAPLLTNADATSVFAMYAKWFGWGSFAATMAIVTLTAMAAAFAVVLLRRGPVVAPEVLEVALLLTFIPLATPQGWDYALLLSTPLIALLIDRARTIPRADRIATAVAIGVVALSLYDLMGRDAYRAFMGWSVITVCYLALVGVAVRVRLQTAA